MKKTLAEYDRDAELRYCCNQMNDALKAAQQSNDALKAAQQSMEKIARTLKAGHMAQECQRTFSGNCSREATTITVSGCLEGHIHERCYCTGHAAEYIKQVQEGFWYCGKCITSEGKIEEVIEGKLYNHAEALHARENLIFLKISYSF